MCKPPGLTIQTSRTLSFPQNFEIKHFGVLAPLRGVRCGMGVGMAWESADGKLASLSQMYCSELISEPVSATGCFHGVSFNVSVRFDTQNGRATDEHGFPVELALSGPGEITLDQVFIYGSSPWTAASNSGFRITHKVEEIAKGRFKVTTSKVPAAVTFSRYVRSGVSGVQQAAAPYRSQAGKGRACVVQIVEGGGLNPASPIKASALPTDAHKTAL